MRALLGLYSDPDKGVREAADKRARELGATDKQIKKAYVEALGSPHGKARLDAVSFLRSVDGEKLTRLMIKALLQLLADQDKEVRDEAGKNLTELGVMVERIAREEIKVLRTSPHKEVRKSAAEHLHKVVTEWSGDPAFVDEMVEGLLIGLIDVDPDVRMVVGNTLNKLEISNKRREKIYIKGLAHSNTEILKLSIKALGGLGSQKAIGRLGRLTGDKTPEDLRNEATEALTQIRAKRPEAFAGLKERIARWRLRRKLDSPDPEKRRAAVNAFGQYEWYADEEAKALVDMLYDEDADIIADAVNMLSRPAGKRAIPYLVERMSEPESSSIRDLVLFGILNNHKEHEIAANRTLRPVLEPLMEPLVTRLSDQDGEVRQAAYETILLIVYDVTRVIADLMYLMENEDEGVRTDAERFLNDFIARFRQNPNVELAIADSIELLSEPDLSPAFYTTVMKALRSMNAPPEQLLEVMGRALRNPDQNVWGPALNDIAGSGISGAKELLEAVIAETQEDSLKRVTIARVIQVMESPGPEQLNGFIFVPPVLALTDLGTAFVLFFVIVPIVLAIAYVIIFRHQIKQWPYRIKLWFWSFLSYVAQPALRVKAVEHLGKIFTKADQKRRNKINRRLISCLFDENPKVVLAVMEILGEIGDQETAKSLLAIVTTGDDPERKHASTRLAAVKILGSMGLAGKITDSVTRTLALRVLLARLRNEEDVDVRAEALIAAKNLNASDNRVIVAYLMALNSEYPEARKVAAAMLANFQDNRAKKPLLHLVSIEHDDEVREAAIDAARNLGATENEIEDARLRCVFAGMQDSVDEVFTERLAEEHPFAEARPSIGTETDVPAQTVEVMAAPESDQEKGPGFLAWLGGTWLGRLVLGTGRWFKIRYLLLRPRSKDAKKRASSIRYLGRHGAANKKILGALIKRLGDEDLDVAAAGLEVFTNAKKRVTVPLLIRALDSDDPAIRFRAAAVLGAIGAAEATSSLLGCLADNDSKVRQTAYMSLTNRLNVRPELLLRKLTSLVLYKNAEARKDIVKFLGKAVSVLSTDSLEVQRAISDVTVHFYNRKLSPEEYAMVIEAMNVLPLTREQIVNALIAASGNDNKDIFTATIYALGDYPDISEARSYLVHIIQNEKPASDRHKAAQEAIVRMDEGSSDEGSTITLGAFAFLPLGSQGIFELNTNTLIALGVLATVVIGIVLYLTIRHFS
ncbi:MAG: HEAT repeat domain-containing protein, partial [Candidatus Omnitrophota bacterium]